ncbi:MAG: hypothetical protein KIT58_16515 [Planctomycetota bacterium]|nr:hypothetical protein [Planctomycetota bacterium]
MTSLIDLVQQCIATTGPDAVVWQNVLRRSETLLSTRLHELVGHVLTDRPHAVTALDRDDLVGLSMAIMTKFRLYSEPVWSSHTLREHLDRFFRLPGASMDSLLEGEIRVLNDGTDGPTMAFAEEFHRILSFERRPGLSSADVPSLLALARQHRKPAFWLQAFWAAQRAGLATPELLAEALIGVRAPAPRARMASGLEGELSEGPALGQCLRRVRELEPGELASVTEALRSAHLELPRLDLP